MLRLPRQTAVRCRLSKDDYIPLLGYHLRDIFWETLPSFQLYRTGIVGFVRTCTKEQSFVSSALLVWAAFEQKTDMLADVPGMTQRPTRPSERRARAA